MPDVPHRNERVELVAAALADADFYPGAWEDTGPLRRAAYRGDAMDLLVKLDAWAAVQIVDLAGVLDTEDGLAELERIVDGADPQESPHG